MLIIMRVAERRAWTSKTGSELQNISSIAFGQPNAPPENKDTQNSRISQDLTALEVPVSMRFAEGSSQVSVVDAVKADAHLDIV